MSRFPAWQVVYSEPRWKHWIVEPEYSLGFFQYGEDDDVPGRSGGDECMLLSHYPPGRSDQLYLPANWTWT